MDYVHEMLPIGSKGALYEAGELAAYVGKRFQLFDEDLPIDLKASAGGIDCRSSELEPR